MTPDISPIAYAIRRALETTVKPVLRFAYTAIARTDRTGTSNSSHQSARIETPAISATTVGGPNSPNDSAPKYVVSLKAFSQVGTHTYFTSRGIFQ